MKHLDLTLPKPAENLACDEALLDCADEDIGEVLRVWEAREFFVVLGYANKAASEVNLQACRERGIPVLRRCSGGGTVLQGPGCINYSLILHIRGHLPLEGITETNCYIMKRNAQAVSSILGREVAVEGFTDLAIDDLKFSGNAQRRKLNWILFHGSFLLDFDSTLMEEVLLSPSRQPSYRRNRAHGAFLSRLDVPADVLKTALREAWNASEPLVTIPRTRLEQLTREKYSTNEWNFKW